MTRPPVDEYAIDWTAPRRRDWSAWMAACGRSSLEQSWAYGEALVAIGRQQVQRGVIRRAGEPVAIVQGFTRRLPGGPVLARIVRGPLWLRDTPTGEDMAAALRCIRASFLRRRGQFLFWLPELADTKENHTAMRTAGLRPTVTGYCSGWWDLSADEDSLRASLRGNWRNQLGRAERGDLRVEKLNRGRLALAALVRYETFRRDRRFVGPSATLIGAIMEEGRFGEDDTLVFCAFQRNEPVAAVFMVRHGNAATYYAGWADERGREEYAHNLLLWRAALALKEAGVRWINMGGLSASAPGVAGFKLGTGATPFVLAGTYF
jgi:hypothetical protein